MADSRSLDDSDRIRTDEPDKLAICSTPLQLMQSARRSKAATKPRHRCRRRSARRLRASTAFFDQTGAESQQQARLCRLLVLACERSCLFLRRPAGLEEGQKTRPVDKQLACIAESKPDDIAIQDDGSLQLHWAIRYFDTILFAQKPVKNLFLHFIKSRFYLTNAQHGGSSPRL